MLQGVFCACVILSCGTSDSRVTLKKLLFQCVFSTEILHRVNVAYILAKAFYQSASLKKNDFLVGMF